MFSRACVCPTFGRGVPPSADWGGCVSPSTPSFLPGGTPILPNGGGGVPPAFQTRTGLDGGTPPPPLGLDGTNTPPSTPPSGDRAVALWAVCLLRSRRRTFFRVPSRTGKTGKPGKLREVFPVREKSGNFKMLLKSQGKVREFWSSQGKVREI